MAQFYRDIQIGTVWEGSGNVIALDVLRAMAKEPESVDAFMAECELARGSDQRFDAHLDATRAGLEELHSVDPQFAARAVVEDMALALQASVLLRTGPASVADAFCAARLGGRHRAFGTLPAGIDAAAVRGARARRLSAAWAGGHSTRFAWRARPTRPCSAASCTRSTPSSGSRRPRPR